MKRVKKIIGTVLILSVCLMPMASYASMEDPDFTLFINKTCLTPPEDLRPGSTAEYQLEFSGVCADYPDRIDTIWMPVITDTLPEGLEFMETEEVEFTSTNEDFYVETSIEGNTITFRPVEIYDGDRTYFMFTNDAMTIKYKCKIGDDVKAAAELTNTAIFSADDDIDPVSDSETIAVAGEDEPAAETHDEPDANEDITPVHDESPKTGDESPIMWVVIAIAATLTTFTMVFRCMEREV